jgi:uncharacterized protein DUF3223
VRPFVLVLFWSPWLPRRASATGARALGLSSGVDAVAYYHRPREAPRPEVPTLAAVLPWGSTGPNFVRLPLRWPPILLEVTVRPTWRRWVELRLPCAGGLLHSNQESNMASRKGSYRVGGEEFSTKEALTQRVQNIRDKYIGGKVVDAADAAFLKDLLQHHADAKTKVGVGIKHFTVEKNKEGTDSFYITRIDDSRDDFSFVKCIRSIPRS